MLTFTHSFHPAPCRAQQQASSSSSQGPCPVHSRRHAPLLQHQELPCTASTSRATSAWLQNVQGAQSVACAQRQLVRAWNRPARQDSASSSEGTSSSGSSGNVGAINKVPVALSMNAATYEYLLQHTREPEVLAQLRAETAAVHGAHMQITPEQGQLFALLVELMGVKKAIEVGVFTGYSSLAVALALPEDGMLYALDRDEGTMAVARRYWAEAGVAHKVKDMVGPGQESMQALLAEHGPGSFDFVFIDADKRAYWAYYEAALQLVRQGGLIAVDNVIFYGKVADPEVKDKATQAIREFNDRVMADPRVTLSIIPVGDGIALCRKR